MSTREIDIACNGVEHVPRCSTRKPAWLTAARSSTASEPSAKAEPETAREAIQAEGEASPATEVGSGSWGRKSDGTVLAFAPLLSWADAIERCAADRRAIEAGDWIERKGADGRRGYDRPGQRVANRWWERFAFDELPEPNSYAGIRDVTPYTPSCP